MPTIPGREEFRKRAVQSIHNQTVDCEIVLLEDSEASGAAVTRNVALDLVKTKWVAFLDDDDEMYPFHVERLLSYASVEKADLVYPWFDGSNAEGVLFFSTGGTPTTPEGAEFGEEHRFHLLHVGNFIPVAVLARTSMVKVVGGFPKPGTAEWPRPDCEDWGLWQRLLRAGAIFAHLPQRTWRYNVHGNNLSGRSWKEGQLL